MKTTYGTKRTQAMPVYYGTKRIRAREMSRGEYNAYRNWVCPADENPEDEGYLVEYLDGGDSNHPLHDGYISWSPKAQFEHAYQPDGKMSFGHALQAIEEGRKVARAGWNGKGMWIALSGTVASIRLVHAEGFWSDHARAHAIEQGGMAGVLPSMIMKTATGEILMGWLASQTDMFAKDWEIVG